jgi:hypothetical protein
MATIDRFEEELLLSFVRNRHAMFVRRQAGLPQSTWTDDPILSSGRSFTNVFRVLDRGTQRLVRMLWSPSGLAMDPSTTLMLCMVYRRTNNTDFWELVPDETMVPNMGDLDEWFGRLSAIATDTGISIFDQHPYLLIGSLNHYRRKRTTTEPVSMLDALRLSAIDWLTGSRWWGNITHVKRADGHYAWHVMMDNLCTQPGISDFLAQQIATDFGYSQYGDARYDDEDVVLGPGSRRGIKRILPEMSLKDPSAARGAIIMLRNEVRSALPEVNLSAADPHMSHTPSLMDVQNCLCEFDKYRRISTGGVYRRKWHDHGRRAITLPNNW